MPTIEAKEDFESNQRDDYDFEKFTASMLRLIDCKLIHVVDACKFALHLLVPVL